MAFSPLLSFLLSCKRKRNHEFHHSRPRIASWGKLPGWTVFDWPLSLFCGNSHRFRATSLAPARFGRNDGVRSEARMTIVGGKRRGATVNCLLFSVYLQWCGATCNLQLSTVFLPLAWRPRRDSNPRHSVPKTDALPLSYTGTPPHILARAPPLWAGFLRAQLPRQYFPKKRVDTPLPFCKNGSVAWSHAFGANRAKKRSGKRRVPLHHRTTTIVISMHFSLWRKNAYFVFLVALCSFAAKNTSKNKLSN